MQKKTKVKKVKIKEEAPLKYRGEVIVQKIYNGKVISSTRNHNKGFEPLFKFLLLCLTGLYDESLLPYYVIPATNENDTYKYANNELNLIASKEVNKANYLEYKFYLPFRQYYKTKGFDSLLLYSKKNAPSNIVFGENVESNYSMVVTFDDILKTDKEDLLIIWDLFIDNQKEN